MGDDAFDAFTQRLMSTLRDAVADHNGREVKSAGDGMMVVFPDSAADAVSCATEMHRVVAELDEDVPRLRIGISTGEVAPDGLDYTGMPIVEAARLESAAKPGQTLANAVVRALVGTRRSFRFAEVGELDLKGIPTPLATVEVVDTGATPPVDESPRSRATTARRRWIAAAGVAAVAIVVLGVMALTRQSSDEGQLDLVSRGLVAPTTYTPTLESIPCPDVLADPPPEATCSQLVAPQDRSLPGGRQVRVLVARAPARVANPSPTPTIDLCMCENLGESIARDHSELIQLGSRGWTGSEPVLACPEMNANRREALAAPADDPGQTQAGRDALVACRARLVADGIDLAQYNANAEMLDVADLMVALGLTQADFTATNSFAAPLFQLAARYPEAVRSVTIENPAPPDRTPLSEPISDLRRSFDDLLALCQQSATCAASYPELAAQWKAVVDQAAAAPALVTAPEPDDDTAPQIELLLDGFRTVDALNQALTDPATYGLIPTAITDPSAQGVIAQQVLRYDRFSWSAEYPWGALASYTCAYDANTVNVDAQDLQAPNLPQFVGTATLHWETWCDAWDVPDLSDALSTSFVGPLPALLFRGAMSPIGNESWIPSIQRGLEHAQVLVFPTLGAGLLESGPPCLSDLRRAFLADPMASLDTAACEATSPPVEFVAPS